jgi:hypothetical protein
MRSPSASAAAFLQSLEETRATDEDLEAPSRATLNYDATLAEDHAPSAGSARNV